MWLDSNLSMGDHITKTSSAAFYYLYNIRRIRKYLSKECTETLIHAFISSRLDYCNSLLYGFQALVRFRNCKESRALLRALYSKKANFVILRHCWEPCTGYPSRIVYFLNLIVNFKDHSWFRSDLHFRTCIHLIYNNYSPKWWWLVVKSGQVNKNH